MFKGKYFLGEKRASFDFDDDIYLWLCARTQTLSAVGHGVIVYSNMAMSPTIEKKFVPHYCLFLAMEWFLALIIEAKSFYGLKSSFYFFLFFYSYYSTTIKEFLPKFNLTQSTRSISKKARPQLAITIFHRIN